jgi:divalent metal cation (Fe/Co/Zn/Cd) transporter
MIAALAYSCVVGFTLGSLKRPVAKKAKNKVLEADADMNRADWVSEGAAIVGITLVAFGFWWGDAGAAAFISAGIVYDGYHNLRQVLGDLMDESPTEMGESELEALPERIKAAAEQVGWVKQAAVRLRESGNVLSGDVFVVPRDDTDLTERVGELEEELVKLDWRLYTLTIMPVPSLDSAQPPRPGPRHRKMQVA